MSAFDRELGASKAASGGRHLARVAAKLPPVGTRLTAASDASDAIVLHLWQAIQLVLDLAFAACLHLRLATPSTYTDAFRNLGQEGVVDPELAERLARAAGFRNVVAHAYDGLDMQVVRAAATQGPADLRAFLAAMAALVSRPSATG